MLTPEQLDWLAEQAGWKLLPRGFWYRVDGPKISGVHPSTSCDRLIADHDRWMREHRISYTIRRLSDAWGVAIWSTTEGVVMWKYEADDADTPQAGLAEAFYHARGGPQ